MYVYPIYPFIPFQKSMLFGKYNMWHCCKHLSEKSTLRMKNESYIITAVSEKSSLKKVKVKKLGKSAGVCLKPDSNSRRLPQSRS